MHAIQTIEDISRNSISFRDATVSFFSKEFVLDQTLTGGGITVLYYHKYCYPFILPPAEIPAQQLLIHQK